jgi:hypothetical protein
MNEKNNSRKPVLIALLVLAPLAYKITRDIFLIGVKDGKTTQAKMINQR